MKNRKKPKKYKEYNFKSAPIVAREDESTPYGRQPSKSKAISESKDNWRQQFDEYLAGLRENGKQLQELRESQKETDRMQKENQKELRELRESQKETDRMQKENQKELRELRESQKETDRMQKENQKELRELRESQKETDKMQKETDKMQKETDKMQKENAKKQKEGDKVMQEIRELQKETDRILKEAAEMQKENQKGISELKEQMQETKEYQKESTKNLNRTIRELKNIGFNIGEVTEDYFIGALQSRTELAGIRYDEVKAHVKPGKGRQGEYDILLLNHETIIVVEVKHKLWSWDVEDFHKRGLARFKRLFPAYAGRSILGAVAGMTVNQLARARAIELGYLVLTQSGQDVKVLNPAGFQPAVF